MVRPTTPDDATELFREAICELAKFTDLGDAAIGEARGRISEEELQGHVDDCVANWRKLLGADLLRVEDMAAAHGFTLRQTAETLVRAILLRPEKELIQS